MVSESRYNAPAVRMAVKLLACLCDSECPLGVSELSRRLDTNKNMVFRLLHTLQEQGWIVQEDGPKYRVSSRPFGIVAVPPASTISLATACASASARSLTTTFAPRAASACACARPRPRPAPGRA